jgi:ubiquinone/menaquinone biosynthesis C-methylase UbiE
MPFSTRDDDAVQGDWLLARLGKRVLRPGGVELTHRLLALADVGDSDVVEVAPGLGRTATEIIDRHPRSHVGAERDPDAARAVRSLVSGHGTVWVADAADTGLPDASSDVVVGEAMLTMQSDTVKHAIIAEAARLLRPAVATRSMNLPSPKTACLTRSRPTFGRPSPSRSRSTLVRSLLRSGSRC